METVGGTPGLPEDWQFRGLWVSGDEHYDFLAREKPVVRFREPYSERSSFDIILNRSGDSPVDGIRRI